MRLHNLALSLVMCAAAGAADSGLSVSTSSKVIYSGQSAEISVSAHFPATAYAFAGSTFGIQAGVPCWNSVSGGVIAGPTVQGIIEGQTHNPFLGIFADPSNPIKIWTGTYTPKTGASLLVPITATPATFSYYPSALTTSTVVTQADPGCTWLFVNPLTIQGVAVAPGKGTALGHYGGGGDDVLIGGTTGFEPLLIGLLVPAVQKVWIHPSIPPLGLTIQTYYEEPVSPSALTFTATVTPDSYNVNPQWPLADEYEYAFEFRGQTIRLRIAAVNNRGATIARLPLTYGVVPSHDPINHDDLNHWRMNFGSGVAVIDPLGRLLVAESMDVWAIHHNSPGELTATTQTIEIRGHGQGGGGAGKASFQDLHF